VVAVMSTFRRLEWQAASMRALVQRVVRAAVDVVAVDGSVDRVGEIGAGLCVLVGATHDDTAELAMKLADKIWQLRILDDAGGVMNRSLAQRHDDGEVAEVLVVSQFTLYGNTDKGRRPSWIDAARPEHAEPLVDHVVARLRESGSVVATGRFRTEMRVELVNDGPVTLLIEV
jgi:D-tyrosyl-tRNA(Tyr) deacylase